MEDLKSLLKSYIDDGIEALNNGLGLLILAFVIVLALSGCTDAEWGKVTALGNSATVECWSGDTKIYEGKSSGKVLSEANSDGYYFRDTATGHVMEVSGNCIITYDD